MAALLLTVGLVAITACDKNNNVVIFSINDDVKLGQQVQAEIAADASYKILSTSDYPEAYAYLNALRDEILNSGKIAYKEQFSWQMHIVHDDNVLNAFATPGGYIYVYTGLIKYLDNADDLAGVLGHEMAHSDRRHTVRNLQKTYGVNMMLSIVLGNNPNALKEIAGQVAGTLAGLSFSREYETEADEQSVEYLSQTKYACNGAAYFFIKLNQSGSGGQQPEFLSTHPNPENRVENINKKASSIGCSTSLTSQGNYQALKSQLP